MMKARQLVVVLALGMLGACSGHYADNRSVAYEELPLGSIAPEGWLRENLELQRDNISANLDETYPEVMGSRNGWLGGDGDQWERGPYWIDGLLPLAYILDDDALKAKVEPWVEWALSSQTEDGNFGPKTDYPAEPGLQRDNSSDWWPRMVMLKVLYQHYNATGDERVLTFFDRYFRYQFETLKEKPLDHWTFWAAFRQADEMNIVLWLYRRTGEKYLLELADLLHEQGFDFVEYFENEGISRPGSIHCVNLAQGLKEPVVYWSATGDDRLLRATDKLFADMPRFISYPTGMFGGDECLRDNDPTRGSELCSAVEFMYSLEEMMKITGNPFYAEYLERIAFNALEAQISDDFRLHQYYQQTNQVSVSLGNHNFSIMQDGTANLMGFLTGYPCCLSNLHQGWPKFTQNLWLRSSDGGLAAIEKKKVPERKTAIVPAGAASLRNFYQHCTACQLCVSVCPNDVLRPSGGLMRLMQPEMSYERGYCRPECTKCSDVCPAGAIRPVTVEEKSSVQIGHAVWIKKNCIVFTDGVECGNCARHCPAGAIQMVEIRHRHRHRHGAGGNPEEEGVPIKIPVINQERCIGCGACENLCPARPFTAIYVEGHEVHREI